MGLFPEKNSRQVRGALSYKRGLWGERIALVYLYLKGYRLLHRRWTCSAGEIDLILKKGKYVVFVEVKTRRTLEEAAFALSHTQIQRLRRAGEIYVGRMFPQNPPFMRYDSLWMAPYRWPVHIQNAF